MRGRLAADLPVQNGAEIKEEMGKLIFPSKLWGTVNFHLVYKSPDLNIWSETPQFKKNNKNQKNHRRMVSGKGISTTRRNLKLYRIGQISIEVQRCTLIGFSSCYARLILELLLLQNYYTGWVKKESGQQHISSAVLLTKRAPDLNCPCFQISITLDVDANAYS